MTYKMTEELAKLLTVELLDEEWHEITYQETLILSGESRTYYNCSCGLNGQVIKCITRTFTSPADQKAVMHKLVEKGLWEDFERWCFAIWLKDTESGLLSEYFSWLFLEEERFCVLAAQFMKETAPSHNKTHYECPECGCAVPHGLKCHHNDI